MQKRKHLYRGFLLTGVMLLSGIISACGADSGGQASSGSSGQQIFQDRCAGCHATSSEKKIGPGLAGLFASGGPKLPDGVDYGGKLPNGQEITDTNVATWIREGGQGEIGFMPGMPVNDQEMAELLAYLKTLQ